jgi:ABC-type nitrate/sulfonate/bicarbonate transport system permease component
VIVLLSRIGLLLAALLLWEIIARQLNPLLYVPPSLVLPGLGRVLSASGLPALPGHFWLTVKEILAAYALAAGAGLGLGFLLGLRRILGEIYEPILAALYAVPSVVWYPTLMLFFGLGPASKIAFGVCLGFFPIVLAALAGIQQVDRHLVTVARSMGAAPGALFLKVLLPGMASTLIGGLRAGLALSVVGVIVGEILGSQAGLGYLINYAYGLLRTPEYVGLVFLAVIIVFAIDGVAALVEARAKRWAA